VYSRIIIKTQHRSNLSNAIEKVVNFVGPTVGRHIILYTYIYIGAPQYIICIYNTYIEAVTIIIITHYNNNNIYTSSVHTARGHPGHAHTSRLIFILQVFFFFFIPFLAHHISAIGTRRVIIIKKIYPYLYVIFWIPRFTLTAAAVSR